MIRKPFMFVAVTTANEITRVLWELLMKGDVYRKPSTAMMA
ncbi:hypothetical protein [Labrys miyagiensis]